MKFLKRVSNLTVKRTFVVSDLARVRRGRWYGKISKEEFMRHLARTKKRVLKMSEKAIDKYIGDGNTRRLKAYNSLTWYLGEADTKEVAVWVGAGSLPRSWTKGNLYQTGKRVKAEFARKSKRLKKRARRAIPAITATSLEAAQREKYLLPIILPAGTLPNCRRGAKRYKGDIDDGCMRSVALAMSGKTQIRAWVGK